MEYLKTWMGVVTGSYMGRDDGHPEKKFQYYGNMSELAKDFGKYKDEEHYQLRLLGRELLEQKVSEELRKSVRIDKNKKKQSIENEIEQLQKQLKGLN